MKYNKIKIPVITASGIALNNQKMMAAGADYSFVKYQIIDGEASDLILTLLNIDIESKRPDIGAVKIDLKIGAS